MGSIKLRQLRNCDNRNYEKSKSVFYKQKMNSDALNLIASVVKLCFFAIAILQNRNFWIHFTTLHIKNHLPERDVIELFSLVLLELRNLDPCFDHYNLYRLCNSYHTLENNGWIYRLTGKNVINFTCCAAISIMGLARNISIIHYLSKSEWTSRS